MEIEMYQKRIMRIREEKKRLMEEEKALNNEFAMSHPWNEYSGKKVRIKREGDIDVNGYMVRIEPFDDIVGCVLMHNVKKDGSEGKKEFRVYFAHGKVDIEVEE